jgi:hypothetical protein
MAGPAARAPFRLPQGPPTVPIEIDAVEKTMREPGLGVRPPAQPPKTTAAPKKR